MSRSLWRGLAKQGCWRTLTLSLLVLGSSAAAWGAEPSKAAARRPNFIVFLIDDLGYGDIGAYGSQEIRTPQIDSLAQHGTRFTQGYATCPVCTPSRAGLLTGRYQQRYGLEWVISPDHKTQATVGGLPPGEKTIADLLRQEGYATGAIGKWHLGDQADYVPNRRGFDYYYGFLQWGHFFLNPTEEELNHPTDPWIRWAAQLGGPKVGRYLSDISNAPIYRNDQAVGFQGYLTEALNQEAVQFVETNKDRPFFLYYAHAAQHAPVQATEKYLKRFPELASDKIRLNYAAALSAVDDGVGEILAKLRELKLDQNTVIVFTSDNGGPSFWKPRPEIIDVMKATASFGDIVKAASAVAAAQGGAPDYRAISKYYQWSIGANGSNNEPLSFGKGILYEGGIRVPFIIQWPGVAPEGKASDAVVSSLDLLPTFLAAAQGKLPADREFDGIDLRPSLEGTADVPADRTLFWRVYKDRAVRSGAWKLVWDGEAAPRLYDLRVDQEETHDVAADHAQIVEKLQQQWHQWNEKNVEPAIVPMEKVLRKIVEEVQ